jgi:hypothetical protein
MKLTSLLCVILIWIGCNSTIANHQEVTLDKDTIITLGRTACYGTCPTYTVTINGQGEVVFEGSKMIRQNGKITAQSIGAKNIRISHEQLQQLIAEFNKIDYLSLKDNYDRQGPDCPRYNTDSPSAITSIKTNGTTKSVKHYSGCEGTDTLKNLTALEKKIDEVVNTDQWLK